MVVDDRRSPSQGSQPCPRCGSPGGTLSLLTSMSRYFVCAECDHRWHVSTAGTSGNEPLVEEVLGK